MEQKFYYIYMITNILNNHVYIGQTINPNYRWYQHKSYALKNNKHKQYIHFAMAKYGIENFTFEIIATSLTQEDINEMESLCIIQYNSRNTQYGYNLMVGGSHGGHSEETKQKIREALLKQIATKDHPAQGTKRTDEQKARMSEIQKNKDNVAIYTEEVREKFSKSHIGIKDSEETKKNKSIKAKLVWQKRQEEKLATGELKCNAPHCDVCGIAKYIFVNGIRYCSIHGQRLRNNGTFDIKPMENRKLTIGKAPNNKKYFTEIQINQIISDSRSNYKVAQDFGVTEKVIKRVREENKTINQYL